MIELNLNAGLTNPGVSPGLWTRLRRRWWPVSAGSPLDPWAECRVDDAARLAWRDPVQFRREQVAAGSRARAVLDEAARRSGWGGLLPPGMARGVAMGEGQGTWLALVAELSDDEAGRHVHRLVAAIDGGPVLDVEEARLEVQRGLRAGLRLEVDEADAVRLDVWWVHGEGGGRVRGEVARRTVAPAVANAVRALEATRARERALAEELAGSVHPRS